MLTPVQRETVQDRVYLELRKALIYGLFEPGQVLTIQDLATSLQTSTMPIREALRRLISEQALEAQPNRSVRVPPVDAERLEDLLRARIAIEGAALELAVARLDGRQIEELKSLNRDYDQAMARRGPTPIEPVLELNKAFHFLIYQASGSQVLIPIIESLWLQSGPYVRAAALVFDPKSEISAPHYHAEIVAALKRKDAASARKALAADIGRAFDLLRAPRGDGTGREATPRVPRNGGE
jgi:DNA-binding GntR family transcriptional regulator